MSEQAVPAGSGMPRPGEVVRDEASGRVGIVMGQVGPYTQLRPLGGGREWDADPGRIVAIERAEILSARLAVVNRRSRQGRG